MSNKIIDLFYKKAYEKGEDYSEGSDDVEEGEFNRTNEPIGKYLLKQSPSWDASGTQRRLDKLNEPMEEAVDRIDPGAASHTLYPTEEKEAMPEETHELRRLLDWSVTEEDQEAELEEKRIRIGSKEATLDWDKPKKVDRE